MTEANKSKYFVDGFLIKYFNIWPAGVSKDDLFEIQKHFLVYLMGCIPTLENWATQVSYQIEKQAIHDLKKVEISQEDIDLVKLQGRDIKELKKERLESEKEQLLYELNKKYGIKNKEDEEMPKRPEGLPERSKTSEPVKQEDLWDLLNGKGLIKKRP